MTSRTHSNGARLDFAGAMTYGDYLHLQPAFKMLARVARIMAQLNQS